MEILKDKLMELQKQKKTLETALIDNRQEFKIAMGGNTPIEKREYLQQEGKKYADALLAVTSEIKKIEEHFGASADKIQWETTISKLKTDSSKKKRATDKMNADVVKILSILKVQITPSSECVEPNDAFIKGLFRYSMQAYRNALQGKLYRIKERKETKKRDAVYSLMTINNVEGYEDDSPLDEFDRAVLGVIISEYVIGNRYTTVNIIHRALIGKVGEVSIRPYKNQEKAIIDSVIKLMGTVADFSQASNSLNEMNYRDKDGNEISLRASNLLFADIIDARINGQIMNGVIYFKDNSPLFDIANAKDQVIRYPHALLNVPDQRNSPLIITLKKYVLRRICEIKLHKQLTPTITFVDIFSKCRLGNVDRHKQLDARNSVIKFLEHLKSQNFITNFEVKKRGNVIHGVAFDF